MAVTDADRIMAAGIPLTLGQREVRVRYTLRSWKEAEDRFGSLEEVLAILRGLIGEKPSEGKQVATVKKEVGTVVALLWAGLLHEDLTEDDIYDLGSVRDLRVYIDAILASINEGTPGPGSGKDNGAMAESPGPTTTTPSPSDTDAVLVSSGT